MREQQAKAARNRKQQMRQRCRLIDNQISVNLSKLDEVMKTIKSNKTQIRLRTIKQVEQHIASDNPLPQSHQSSQHDTKNSLHLKFKYSVQRQYEFTETHDRQRAILKRREFQTNRNCQLQKEETIKGEIQQYPSTSEFTPSPSKREDEELLLLSEASSNLQNQQELRPQGQGLDMGEQANKMNTKFLQYRRLSNTNSITIQTRYDWMSSYLDTELNDTIIKAHTPEGEQVTVVSFDQNRDQFLCKLNQITNQKPQFQIISYSNCTRKNSTFSHHELQLIKFTYKDFIHYNPELEVQFYKHNLHVDIMRVGKQEVIKLDLTNSQKRVRLLIKSQNHNTNNMQRIMIFKKLPSSNPNDEKHQIVWSKYDKMPFVQDVILQGESNYLIANMCRNPSSAVSLIFNPKNIQNVKIQKSNYDPWKSYNILCSSFQECTKVFMSLNVFDGSKPLEFLRSNFLDFGLVLEIYQNIYSEKVAFLDNKQKNESHKEDIQLLFPEIYTTQQNHNVYLPKQLVIKFFQVTEKPARLYFPQKRVLVGSKIAQNITIHSTFK